MIYYLKEIQTSWERKEKPFKQNPTKEEKLICKTAKPSSKVRWEAAHSNNLLHEARKIDNFTVTPHRSELPPEVRKYATLIQLLKTRASTNKIIIPLQHT